MPLQNRSLERGLAVLDCFRPGGGALAHHEIAERTGLPKPTVTRLVATLAEQGYLVRQSATGGYLLGVPVLSLARAHSLADELRDLVAPAIVRLANATASIIGFGTAHGTDIVYIAAHNGDPARPERSVGAGMRAPIATTSVGRAWLAGVSNAERAATLARLEASRQWQEAFREPLQQSLQEVARYGDCKVCRSDGLQCAIGSPIAVRGAPLHALGIGYQTAGMPARQRVPVVIAQALQELRAEVARFNGS